MTATNEEGEHNELNDIRGSTSALVQSKGIV
jgi:hypothetical protein